MRTEVARALCHVSWICSCNPAAASPFLVMANVHEIIQHSNSVLINLVTTESVMCCSYDQYKHAQLVTSQVCAGHVLSQSLNGLS